MREKLEQKSANMIVDILGFTDHTLCPHYSTFNIITPRQPQVICNRISLAMFQSIFETEIRISYDFHMPQNSVFFQPLKNEKKNLL